MYPTAWRTVTKDGTRGPPRNGTPSESDFAYMKNAGLWIETLYALATDKEHSALEMAKFEEQSDG